MFRFSAFTFSTLLLASPALACADYDAAVAAVQADDAATAAALFDGLVADNDCSDDFREWVGDFLARDAFAVTLTDADAATKRAALQTALGYERHWRSFAGLGHLDWADENYAAAAANFQLALNELAEGDQSHQAETDEIAEIYQLATASMALADDVVDLPTTRSGNPSVMMTGKVRGFEVEEIPLPITFEYNSVQFDEAGLDYANALVNHLLMVNPVSVNLGGHTDPVGGEDFNLALSAARADALADYIRASGFKGEIVTTPYGESRLPTPPEGITAGSEEHHRIARRVSFTSQ